MTMLFQKGEDMTTNILLVNQKGGVGKTTFADEIAWGLERRGHKVGFGNLDPQGGANHEKNLLDDDTIVGFDIADENLGATRSVFLLDPRLYGISITKGF